MPLNFNFCYVMGSGCDTVGSVVASNTRVAQVRFRSLSTLIEQLTVLLTVCRRDKNMDLLTKVLGIFDHVPLLDIFHSIPIL